MSLSAEQLDALLAPLSPGRVRSLDGNNHLEAWDVRRWLLRIFGFGGFTIETIECAVVSERSVWDDKNPLKGRHTVIYRAQVRLTVRDPQGNNLAFFEDGALGDGINQPSLLKAHDFAMKTALSQALKRCAVNLGDCFGLSLYDRGKAGETVVGRSLAHSVITAHPTREYVVGGELDRTPTEEQSTSSVVEPPPVPDPIVSPLGTGDGGQDQLETVEETVSALRQRVLDAMQERNRNTALQMLTRISMEAGQRKLLNEQTMSPAGVPMTVNVLVDEAIKIKTRTEK